MKREPANDVGIAHEIEAARILAELHVYQGYAAMDFESAVGAAAYDADSDPRPGRATWLWHAGWLMRCAWRTP